MLARDIRVVRAQELLKNDCTVEQALVLLSAAASDGNPEANYALGTLYGFGRKVEKNPTLAARYLEIAARGGYVDAMFDLAVAFETGDGVMADLEKAFEFYLRAAIRGDSLAVIEIARCYKFGIGVAVSGRVAEIWALRADELGSFEGDAGSERS